MILNEDDKRQLKELKKHPWFKILERLEQEASNILFKHLSNFDLSNPESIKIIQKEQIYQKARNDFIYNTEDHLKEIQEFNTEWMLNIIENY